MLPGACEIPDVVRDDRPTLGGHGEFQNELVVRISQTWTPEEVNLLPMPYQTQVVDNRRRIIDSDAELARMSDQHSLMLKDERHRQRDLEAPVGEQLQQPERCPAS